MPCIHCGNDDRDYCSGCMGSALELLNSLIDLYHRTDQDNPDIEYECMSAADFVDAVSLIVRRAEYFIGAEISDEDFERTEITIDIYSIQ